MTAALEARGLVVRAGDAEVVRGVDLAVGAGEIVAVLGPSGAGKSTLFGALVGELAPAAGAVRLAGRDVTGEPLWRRARLGLGYLPQGPSCLFNLSVRDNFATFERVAASARGAAPLGADAWAARVDLAYRLSVRARDLSGGERRRLELGRAIVGAPSVLVCDEPFAGVDPAGAAALGALLAAEAARGTAVLLADHHVEHALSIAPRAELLLDGEVRARGTPDELRADPLVRARYLATWR